MYSGVPPSRDVPGLDGWNVNEDREFPTLPCGNESWRFSVWSCQSWLAAGFPEKAKLLGNWRRLVWAEGRGLSSAGCKMLLLVLSSRALSRPLSRGLEKDDPKPWKSSL